MGKKACQQISKSTGKEEKLKVVKPRVYITERSRFKKLVQELTGNGTDHSIPVAEEVGLPVLHDNQTEYQCIYKVMNTDFSSDHHHHHHPISVEVYSNSSDDLSTASPLSSVDEDCDLSDDLHKFLQDYSTPHEMEMEMNPDLFACQEIDSSLLDTAETSSLYDWFSQMEQEVSFYDYELAGLLS